MSDATAREICVDNLDDPRLRPYRNLRERTLRGESIFVAEGALVVERLAETITGIWASAFAPPCSSISSFAHVTMLLISF